MAWHRFSCVYLKALPTNCKCWTHSEFTQNSFVKMIFINVKYLCAFRKILLTIENFANNFKTHWQFEMLLYYTIFPFFIMVCIYDFRHNTIMLHFQHQNYIIVSIRNWEIIKITVTRIIKMGCSMRIRTLSCHNIITTATDTIVYRIKFAFRMGILD